MARHCASSHVYLMERLRAFKSETEKMAPTSGPVEATCCEAIKLFLLLALVVRLCGMLVSCFRFIHGLS